LLDAQTLINSFGAAAVFGVALILFIETATIFGSFLPGDSLIFILGVTLSTVLTGFPIWLAALVVVLAAVAGSQIGYWSGKKIGPALFNRRKQNWFFNQKSIDGAKSIIDRFGPRAIVLARFVPIVRALVPMLVGMVGMTARNYLKYNLIGALLWAGGLLLLGWGLGSLPVVQSNVEFWVLCFVILSSLPFPLEVLREYSKRRREKNRLSNH
jgi:membrane-associated protein